MSIHYLEGIYKSSVLDSSLDYLPFSILLHYGLLPSED